MSAQFALMNSQSQMSHQQLLLKKMKSLEKILKESAVGYYASLSPSLLLLAEIQCSCHSSLLSSSLAHLISLPPLPFALMNLLQLPSIVQLPVVIRSSCTYFLDIQAPDMFCSCHQHSSKLSKAGIIKNRTHIHTTLLYSFSHSVLRKSGVFRQSSAAKHFSWNKLCNGNCAKKAGNEIRV